MKKRCAKCFAVIDQQLVNEIAIGRLEGQSGAFGDPVRSLVVLEHYAYLCNRCYGALEVPQPSARPVED